MRRTTTDAENGETRTIRPSGRNARQITSNSSKTAGRSRSSGVSSATSSVSSKRNSAVPHNSNSSNKSNSVRKTSADVGNSSGNRSSNANRNNNSGNNKLNSSKGNASVNGNSAGRTIKTSSDSSRRGKINSKWSNSVPNSVGTATSGSANGKPASNSKIAIGRTVNSKPSRAIGNATKIAEQATSVGVTATISVTAASSSNSFSGSVGTSITPVGATGSQFASSVSANSNANAVFTISVISKVIGTEYGEIRSVSNRRGITTT